MKLQVQPLNLFILFHYLLIDVRRLQQRLVLLWWKNFESLHSFRESYITNSQHHPTTTHKPHLISYLILLIFILYLPHLQRLLWRPQPLYQPNLQRQPRTPLEVNSVYFSLLIEIIHALRNVVAAQLTSHVPFCHSNPPNWFIKHFTLPLRQTIYQHGLSG